MSIISTHLYNFAGISSVGWLGGLYKIVSLDIFNWFLLCTMFWRSAVTKDEIDTLAKEEQCR